MIAAADTAGKTLGMLMGRRQIPWLAPAKWTDVERLRAGEAKFVTRRDQEIAHSQTSPQQRFLVVV